MLKTNDLETKMASEVINELKTAFQQLKEKATGLLKEVKSRKYHNNEGILNDQFMMLYYKLRTENLQNYKRLVSELKTTQEKDAVSFLEDEINVLMEPVVVSLLERLNDAVNTGFGSTATTTRPERPSATQQETRDALQYGSSYTENRNNNNRISTRSVRSAETERSVVNLARRPEVKIMVFKGDPLMFNRFI